MQIHKHILYYTIYSLLFICLEPKPRTCWVPVSQVSYTQDRAFEAVTVTNLLFNHTPKIPMPQAVTGHHDDGDDRDYEDHGDHRNHQDHRRPGRPRQPKTTGRPRGNHEETTRRPTRRPPAESLPETITDRQKTPKLPAGSGERPQEGFPQILA